MTQAEKTKLWRERNAVHKKCERCSDDFVTDTSKIKKGYGRFCSISCAKGFKKIEKKCFSCEKTYKTHVCIDRKFCSESCLNTYKKTKADWSHLFGEKNVTWKGDARMKRERITRCGVTKVKYRFDVEKFIGRDLKTKEIVHHIDLNEKNNDLSNLFIFRSQSSHLRWHRFLKKHGLDEGILKSNLQDLCLVAV